MLLVDKDVSVPGLAGSQIDHSLIGLGQWPGLDPWLDLLLDGKSKHILDVLGRTDGAAADLDAVGDEGERVDLGQLAAVRCAVQLALVRQGGNVGEDVTYPTWMN